ncbi:MULTISPECIES: Na+-dependent transporter [Brachybacterium]|uniref:Na+-dependent transporter n=2 Tax=Brachybacterium alimentarium TaxID=47845 RepID=A0A2A3YKV9_9MICO|nr:MULTISPECIES: Na+-dependent transporter [Brachybacterium]PCC31173.1 Na+-dependent transporter [Brachybacterium alimentarium]PCC39954.1 Na+-dependent transporter [Brachybacterium alimentarium]RCS65677.1 Na+-dependent transporter [Brachybacterium sp. JB7]RCS67284.1 Na+-dependent transporter [Brachybacterium alimentarium]RCS71217.1 Na+-dependent transporter [Brachybacterium alimentarium]
MSTIEALLADLIHVSVPAFAIASMLSMGLRTPLRAFRQQLRDRRTVLAVLGANFVVVPAVGTLLIWLLEGILPHQTGSGFIIALCAAGAPFVLQLGAMARVPYSEIAGPMAVLLLGSIVFMPLVVPSLLQHVAVDGWAVARLLLGTMLSPMIAGIVIAAVWPRRADLIARIAGGVAAVSAVLLFLSGLGANTGLVLQLLLSPVLLVAVGLVVLAFVAGRLSGDLAGDTLTLSDGPAILTSQRNIAAALLVARTGNGDSSIVVAILLLSAVGFVMLVPYTLASGLIRRRRAGEKTSVGVLLGVVGPKTD